MPKFPYFVNYKIDQHNFWNCSTFLTNIYYSQEIWKNLSVETLWKFFDCQAFSLFKTFPGCRAHAHCLFLQDIKKSQKNWAFVKTEILFWSIGQLDNSTNYSLIIDQNERGSFYSYFLRKFLYIFRIFFVRQLAVVLWKPPTINVYV